MPNTSTESRGWVEGFTLLEVLVALGILAVVMTILHSTLSISPATDRVVHARADELSSLTGALDTLSQEVRGAYERFSGEKTTMTFTALTPFRGDTMPVVQTISYEFSEGRMLRRIGQAGGDAKAPRVFLLLEGVEDPSLSFFDGRAWVGEWRVGERLPAGVKVSFAYRGRQVTTVIPVWTKR